MFWKGTDCTLLASGLLVRSFRFLATAEEKSLGSKCRLCNSFAARFINLATFSRDLEHMEGTGSHEHQQPSVAEYETSDWTISHIS